MNNVKQSTEKLKEYFYNTFKNNDYKTTLLHLYNIDERERIINELAENQEEAYYYNNIYEITLNQIAKIFKNNDVFIKAKEKERACLLWENTQKKQEQKQKEVKKWQIIKKCINIFFIFINPITIILYLLIWGYFKFAIPILG